MAKTPLMGAGMELYGAEWDELMPKHNIAQSGPRSWEEDLSDLFPKDFRLDRHSFDAFFHHVRRTQEWLSDGIPAHGM